jgi:hypothetical protein
MCATATDGSVAGSMVTTMHGTNRERANFPTRAPAGGVVAGIRLEGAVRNAVSAETTRDRSGVRTGVETSVDGAVSRIPYPTLDQVARSVAIQRLLWLRHLPAPQTATEHCVFQRIRSLGWSAPG